MNNTTDSDNGMYYFIGNITSHMLHAFPLWKRLGGTFVVTSSSAKKVIEQYKVPVVCIDDVPYIWRWSGKRPYRQREYIALGPRFGKTATFLNERAQVLILYELFEFSHKLALNTPKKVFLTHGNMLKNYFHMYPRRLEIVQTYDYMAALGPYMKKEFIKSGISPDKLVDIGIARTDEIVAMSGKVSIPQSLQKLGVSKKSPIVSYLPTFWGDSSVEHLGPKILAAMPTDYTVLFRPHPQTPPHILQKYSDVCKQNNIFLVAESGPESPSLLDILLASSVIMGDLSSVMLEALLLDKPLVFVETDSSRNANSHNQLHEVQQFSQTIAADTVDSTDTIIQAALEKGVDTALWEQTKQNSFYDYDGSSAVHIATFLQSLATKDA